MNSNPACLGVLLTRDGGHELFPPVSGCSTPQLHRDHKIMENHSAFLSDDGVLALCGGHPGPSPPSAECIVFNPLTKQWQQNSTMMGNLPEERSYAADVTVPGVGTYLLGGRNDDSGQITSTSAFLPSTSNTWQPGPALPQALHAICAVSYNQSIFVIGGQTETSYLKDVREYNTVTHQWLPASTWPQLDKERYHISCAIVGRTVVVAGSVPGAGGVVATDIINLESKLRTPGGDFQASSGVKLASAGRASNMILYAFGQTRSYNEWGGVLRYGLVWKWHEDTSSWSEERRMETSVTYMSAVAVPTGLMCLNDTKGKTTA